MGPLTNFERIIPIMFISFIHTEMKLGKCRTGLVYLIQKNCKSNKNETRSLQQYSLNYFVSEFQMKLTSLKWFSDDVMSKFRLELSRHQIYYESCDFCKMEKDSSPQPKQQWLFLSKKLYSSRVTQIGTNERSPHTILKRPLAQIYIFSWSSQHFTIRCSTQKGGSPCVFNLKELHWLVYHKKIYNGIFLTSTASCRC